MRIIKSFFIAFSMYSKIPVPQFPWKEEDMKYIFCFFPWIGALIGVCMYAWSYFCNIYHVGAMCRTAIYAAIPLLITGGIHVDGYMDTMDAIHCIFGGIFRNNRRALIENCMQRLFPLTLPLWNQCGFFSTGEKRRNAIHLCRQLPQKNCERLLISAKHHLHWAYALLVIFCRLICNFRTSAHSGQLCSLRSAPLQPEDSFFIIITEAKRNLAGSPEILLDGLASSVKDASLLQRPLSISYGTRIRKLWNLSQDRLGERIINLGER